MSNSENHFYKGVHYIFGALFISLFALIPASGFAAAVHLRSTWTTREVTLDVQPSVVVYSRDGESIFVGGSGPYGEKENGGSVIQYDRRKLEILRRFSLPHSVDELQLSTAGDRLVAAGNFQVSSNGGLSSIRLSDGAIASVRMDFTLRSPSISIDSNGITYLSHLQSNKISAIPPIAFDVEGATGPNALFFDTLDARPYFFDGSSRIRKVIASTEEGIIFVVPDKEARLYALELRGFGAILTQSGFVSENSVLNPPLAVTARRLGGNGKLANRMAFLLADHQRQTLALQMFDPKFRTLDLITTVGLGNMLVAGSRVEILPGTSSLVQPMLLATGLDFDTILSGNIYSRDLLIFSFDGDGNFLELLGTLKLDDPPTAMAVHPSGEDAVVLMKDRRVMEVISFRPPGPNSNLTSDVQKEVEIQRTGTETVREIQKQLTRLGFPVGSIDGMLGQKTRFSLELAMKEYMLNFEMSDLNSVARQLEETAAANSK